MPIREIHNVVDLLIHVIAEELGKARRDGRLRDRYPALDSDEASVAWILDGITIHSLEGLLTYRREHGWPETPPPHNPR